MCVGSVLPVGREAVGLLGKNDVETRNEYVKEGEFASGVGVL